MIDSTQKFAGQLRRRHNTWAKQAVRNLSIEQIRKQGQTKKALLAEIERQEILHAGRAAARYVPPPLGAAGRRAELDRMYIKRSHDVAPPTVQDEASVNDYRVIDRAPYMRLIRWAFWKKYSNRFGSRCFEGVALVIRDADSGELRALRVGPNVQTITEALAYIKPASVKKAESAGHTVIRQGDVYLVPARRANYEALRESNHHVQITDCGAVITHPQHPTVVVEGNWAAHQQIVVAHGVFGGGRVAGRAD